MSVSAGWGCSKQNPDGDAPAGFVVYLIDEAGNPYVIDETGIQRYLDLTAPCPADLTPAAAVTDALFAATWFSSLTIRIAPGAGSGVFAAQYGIPTASMRDGAKVYALIDLPASANPTLQFASGAGGGASILTLNSPAAAAQNWFALFIYNATANAWKCATRNQNQ